MGGTKGILGWVRKHKLAVFLLVVIGITGSVLGYIYLAPYFGDDETSATPITSESTFTLYSYVDGEDVSSFVEMDIWVPKSGADFDEGMEDVTALSTNFEREVTGKDADDISIDLSIYDYVWAEITGNTVFDNDFILLVGPSNRDYGFYGHHRSSDVNFNILDSTMSALAYGVVAGGETTKGVDSNYTAVLKAPHLTKTNCHYGDIGWELTATDFAELTLREKEIVWNENYWRDQFVVYDPTADTINEYDRDFEIITNAPALKWVMNATINVTDGATTQINCTIAKGYPIDVLISGANLYMVWYEGFDFNPAPYSFEFELFFGTAINVTSVHSGRADIPGSLSSLSWSETYSLIGS